VSNITYFYLSIYIQSFSSSGFYFFAPNLLGTFLHLEIKFLNRGVSPSINLKKTVKGNSKWI